MPTVEELQYMAAHVDGDGCIQIVLPSDCRRHLGFVWIRIDKTVKNPHMLQWFVDKFGGKVAGFRALSQQRANNSDTMTWKIEHGAAIQLCKLLQPHTRIKGRRFPVDAVRRSKLTPVTITKGDESHTFESFTKAGDYLSRTMGAVRFAMHSGGLCAGWSVSEAPRIFSRDQLKQLIEQMHWSLRFMKKIPDEPITEFLSLPYVAGLFDSEGSISILGKNSATITISQKDPAIRIALQRDYGGSGTSVGNWNWRAPKWRSFLASIRPYCVEKAAQIDLVLAMDGNGPEVKAKLDPLQRNKRKRVGQNCSICSLLGHGIVAV